MFGRKKPEPRNPEYDDLPFEVLLTKKVEIDEAIKHRGSMELDGFVARFNALASSLGVTSRHLERAFQQHVGLSPKVFCRLARFHHLRRLLAVARPPVWSHLACECGYYDQAHLIREVRHFTGRTPKNYRGDLEVGFFLYGPERQPLQYFPLTKDVTLIGRLDAVEGSFPDIDVRPFVDEATARKMSRRHALILRSRMADSYTLRPLPGNTGTQIEADMVPAQADYPLQPGTRMILGGAVRFKFEIV